MRLTLLAAILASAVATIDGGVVNVALPAIERHLGGGLPGQRWVANAYPAANFRRLVKAATCPGWQLVRAPKSSLPQEA
jgi:hypothetical protein